MTSSSDPHRYPARIPEALYQLTKRYAESAGQSVNQWIVEGLEMKVAEAESTAPTASFTVDSIRGMTSNTSLLSFDSASGLSEVQASYSSDPRWSQPRSRSLTRYSTAEEKE